MPTGSPTRITADPLSGSLCIWYHEEVCCLRDDGYWHCSHWLTGDDYVPGADAQARLDLQAGAHLTRRQKRRLKMLRATSRPRRYVTQNLYRGPYPTHVVVPFSRSASSTSERTSNPSCKTVSAQFGQVLQSQHPQWVTWNAATGTVCAKNGAQFVGWNDPCPPMLKMLQKYDIDGGLKLCVPRSLQTPTKRKRVARSTSLKKRTSKQGARKTALKRVARSRTSNPPQAAGDTWWEYGVNWGDPGWVGADSPPPQLSGFSWNGKSLTASVSGGKTHYIFDPAIAWTGVGPNYPFQVKMSAKDSNGKWYICLWERPLFGDVYPNNPNWVLSGCIEAPGSGASTPGVGQQVGEDFQMTPKPWRQRQQRRQRWNVAGGYDWSAAPQRQRLRVPRPPLQYGHDIDR